MLKSGSGEPVSEKFFSCSLENRDDFTLPLLLNAPLANFPPMKLERPWVYVLPGEIFL
jgi:hypothetical protein